MENRKIKIIVRGHKISAVLDFRNQVWVSERKRNLYKLWDITGAVEDGFAPLFEEYEIV